MAPMMRIRLWTFGACIACLLALAPAAHAGDTPMDTVKTGVNAVLDALRDPAYQGDENADALKARLSQIGHEFFDYVLLGQRALGRNWRDFSTEQRKEFVQLFSSLLEQTYTDRLKAYSDEKVVFGKENKLTDKKAEVDTTIVQGNKEIPIKYRLYFREGQWQVYDVLVEGISVLRNWRSQFEKFLADKSPEDLLQRLREKTASGSDTEEI